MLLVTKVEEKHDSISFPLLLPPLEMQCSASSLDFTHPSSIFTTADITDTDSSMCVVNNIYIASTGSLR